MGCVESRLEGDLQTNTFPVVNVNERGQRQRSSLLEVTETHLVLHQRGRTPIRWPLRCLRRYGFDAEQFSFESGRRCPTGPGIYNFKCRRAEALFNLLQYQIQNIAEDAASREFVALPSEGRELTRTDSRVSGALDSQGYLEPLARTRTRGLNTPISSPPVVSATGVNGGVGMGQFSAIGGLRSPGTPGQISLAAVSFFGNADPVELTNRIEDNPRSPRTPGFESQIPREPPSTPLDNGRNLLGNYVDRTVNYINNNADRPSSYSSSGSERPGPYVNHIDRPLSYINKSERLLSSVKLENPDYSKMDELMSCRQHLYMNVDTSNNKRDRDHVYANLGLDEDSPIVPPRACSGSSGTTTTTDTEQPAASQITYIQVDIDKGSDSSLAAPLSPLGSVNSVVTDYPRSFNPSGYATIDFDKTEALSSTAKAAAMWKSSGKDGSRNSRHNSTFTPIPSLGRHNSILSD